MLSKLVSKTNHALGINTPDDAVVVKGKIYNELKADWDAHITADGISKFDTIGEYTSGNGTVVGGVKMTGNVISLASGGISITPNVKTLVALATLTAAQIVGSAAGDIGSTAGAELVAAPGAGYVLQLIGAVLVFDYAGAAYTAGGDDNVIQNGLTATALSVAIAGADLLEASGDKIAQLNALPASDQALVENTSLNLKGTALTQPGSAAGVLRAYVTYNLITTGL